MADTTITQDRKKVDPNLKDLMDLLKKDIMINLNCHAVGTIQSFDATKQTVQATINYKKTIFTRASDGVYKSTLIDYPVLLDVPVISMGGGLFRLTFPIKKGDECLILFNDRSIDNWFQSSQVGPLASGRLHSLSDGFALIGVNSLAHLIVGYSETHAELKNHGAGQAVVGVGDTTINIANSLYTLNGLLQELVTEVKNLVTATAAITVTGVTTGPGVSGVPANAATITAINTNITATALKISNLLE